DRGIRIVDVQAMASVVQDQQVEDPPQVRVRPGSSDEHADASLVRDGYVLEYRPSRFDGDPSAPASRLGIDLEIADNAGVRLDADPVEVAVLEQHGSCPGRCRRIV